MQTLTITYLYPQEGQYQAMGIQECINLVNNDIKVHEVSIEPRETVLCFMNGMDTEAQEKELAHVVFLEYKNVTGGLGSMIESHFNEEDDTFILPYALAVRLSK